MTYRRKSPEALVDELKSLLATNAAGNVQLAGRLHALLKEGASALRAQRGASDNSALLARLLDFQLAAYSVITTHALGILNELIDSAERTILDTAEQDNAEPAAGRGRQRRTGADKKDVIAPHYAEGPQAMRLEGRLGEALACPFLVENQYDRALDVSFEAAPLLPTAGPVLPAALVSFEPTRLALPPRGQAVAQARIELTDDFAVGETYSTALHVLGFQAPPVRLAITVLAAKAGRLPEVRNRAEQPEPVGRSRPPRARRATSVPAS